MRRVSWGKVAAVGCAVAACTGVFASSAAATAPLVASGMFTVPIDNFGPPRLADGNTFALEIATIDYSGDLTGLAPDTDTVLTYKDGSFRAHGTEVCTACTLGGSPGGFTAVFTYAGSPTATGFQFTGHLTFTSGSGGLAGLHGQGTFQGNEVGNTYSYNYSFGP
jgi:hypothetical protein